MKSNCKTCIFQEAYNGTLRCFHEKSALHPCHNLKNGIYCNDYEPRIINDVPKKIYKEGYDQGFYNGQIALLKQIENIAPIPEV